MQHNDTDNNKSRYSGTEQTENAENRPTDSRGATGLQRVRENRAALEDLADSDLPVAGWADDLLHVVDDVDGDQNSADGSGGDTDR
jgi:hypothetical protein